MRYWGPWSTFYKKTGGTISGNVIVNGTLQVDGVTTLNNDVNVDGQVIITYDDPAGLTPHLKLVDKTAGGNINAIWFENNAGGFKGAVYGGNGNIVCIAPGSAGSVRIPDTSVESNPTWKVPYLSDSLLPRRMLLLHSVMFG